MGLIVVDAKFTQWMQLIQDAEKECAATLTHELKSYLASLLDRYLQQSNLANKVFATAYLEALQSQERHRETILQMIGDECLLYAGFFPLQAKKKGVPVDYFTKLGRSAYQIVSHTTNDLCALLASRFVLLTDILQTIRHEPILLPLDAYERWEKTGSQRAYNMLLLYTNRMTLKQ